MAYQSVYPIQNPTNFSLVNAPMNHHLSVPTPPSPLFDQEHFNRCQQQPLRIQEPSPDHQPQQIKIPNFLKI
ncbi:hypothetical protein FRX31_005170 [Thalictrum thalictroides]|uniref:Uncharacterized protein n=1 Tax=Thalictrum thalictroides TaxID=46969 RepID=A0A7J6X766_THATH|nr:hypothetical protein FRX31_005170 [Thalictrum thalictroides]